MKLALILLVFEVGVRAALMVGPIPVSGSGMFSGDTQDGILAFSVGGTSGSDSARFNVTSFFDLPRIGFGGFPGLFLPRGYYTGSAVIDGIGGTQFDYSTNFGNGASVLNVYDNATGLTLLASATLIGYVSPTSYQFNGLTATGTFAISPTPEPSSILLACIGICLLGWRLRKVTKTL